MQSLQEELLLNLPEGPVRKKNTFADTSAAIFSLPSFYNPQGAPLKLLQTMTKLVFACLFFPPSNLMSDLISASSRYHHI